MKKGKKMKKIFVGLSGGVDSSVAAALLKRRGYDVTGVFIKVWSPEWLPCTWRADRRDAMRVAAALDIPFLTLDLSDEYKRGVVDKMVREYARGNVPNPDILCNKEVKFGAFLEFAFSRGADGIATGHYARITDAAGGMSLEEARDANKDQTYFLSAIKKEYLPHILFPVGEYEKRRVRELAHRFGLPTARKKDSQGLCFLGHIEMKDFLRRFTDDAPGDVLDERGSVIGRHDGAFFYTLGQRHGFSVFRKAADAKPLYIVGKDMEKNTITVSSRNPDMSGGKEIFLRDVNWISVPPEEGSVRIRYRGEKHPCRISLSDRGAVLSFDRPLLAQSGQSAAVYDGKRCVGGGVIA